MKKLIKKVENLGWNIEKDYNNTYLLSIESPAEQDFNIYVDCEGDNVELFISNLYDQYDNFDVSYETYLWLDDFGHGKNGAPYEMIDVYNDMKWCHEAIYKLYVELR